MKALVRRRELLLAGAAAALVPPAIARAAGTNEGTLMTGLRRREMNAMFAYGQVIHAHPLLAQLRRHAELHAQAIATELAAYGLGTPPPPQAPEELDSAAARVAQATPDTVLEAALALEEDLELVYKGALPAIREAKAAMTVATILASHAQHVIVVRAALGRPDPLESR
jgi:hypothetical protein